MMPDNFTTSLTAKDVVNGVILSQDAFANIASEGAAPQ